MMEKVIITIPKEERDILDRCKVLEKSNRSSILRRALDMYAKEKGVINDATKSRTNIMDPAMSG